MHAQDTSAWRNQICLLRKFQFLQKFPSFRTEFYVSFAANHFQIMGVLERRNENVIEYGLVFLIFAFIAGNETREGSSCERDRSAIDPGIEQEEVVNPYPLVIVPKYGSPTPLKSRGNNCFEGRMYVHELLEK